MNLTVEEAIRIINSEVDGRYIHYPDRLASALRLGVEALKQVKQSRFDPSTWRPKQLPGETEK